MNATSPIIIGDCTLYHGDCMQILPALGRVDAVVTDPPYGIGKRMSGGTWGSCEKYKKFITWDVAPPDENISALLLAAPICAIWGGNYFSLPPSRSWLVWDKQNAVPTMSDVELAWTNTDRPAKRKSLPVGVHEHGHPTEKPIRLIVWTIEAIRVGEGATVLDPYMGSGTTAIACIRTGRKFVGIEIDEGYFKIACDRIRREYAQGRLPL